MRRIWLGLVIYGLVLGATANAQETRIFVDDAGNSVEIPVSPQRIVSLRGEYITTPLLELGAPVVGSSGRIDSPINDGRPYVRGAYDQFHFRFENSDIAWIGNPNEPDFEAVAAVDPDLIFIPSWQSDLHDRLSIIAPTLVIDVWHEQVLEGYQTMADAVGRLEEFEAGMAGYRATLERAREIIDLTIGDPSEVSVALADVRRSDLYVSRVHGSLTQVLGDMGFGMPELIAETDTASTEISPELLHEIDADFLIGTYNLAFDQSPVQCIEEWDALVPGWDDILHAPRNNQHILLNREPLRALSFRSLETTLDILLSHLATRDFVSLGEDD